MSDKEGFISIYRRIQDHWICNSKHPYSQFEAWMDILLNVNQKSSSPINIDGKKFIAERGQSLFSLETWAKRWRWDKSKVRRFIDKLQADEMVVINNEKKTTRLTVCNYDNYQPKRHKVDTGSTPNNNILPYGSNITIRRDDFKKELAPYLEAYGKDMLNAFFKHWAELNKAKTKMKFEMEKTWELNLRLSKWKNNDFGPKKSTTNAKTWFPKYNGEEVGNG